MMHLYVVTGTTKGIGAALVNVIGESNENLVIEISRGFSGKNASKTLLEADFADLKSVESAMMRLSDAIQHLSTHRTFARATLINNAGVVEPVDQFDRLDAEQLSRNLAVNLSAPIVMAQAFAKTTRAIAKERLIVNISSGAAKRAVAGWTAYCAAKAGLEMATRVMAMEAAANDPTLAVCSLAPGVVDTAMQAVIRHTSTAQFPDGERFRVMKEEGALREPNAVARDIISLVSARRLTNGGNFDIREMSDAN